MTNVGPSQIPNSGSSATKPAYTISKEDFLIGTHPWLYNKDHTRYGGLTVIPKHLLAMKDDDKREALIDEYLAIMAAKPLTDEEKRQKDEWDRLILPDAGPNDYLDDDLADDIIACCEGHGEFPDIPESSIVRIR